MGSTLDSRHLIDLFFKCHIVPPTVKRFDQEMIVFDEPELGLP